MYCSTCGAYVADRRTHCTECGERVARSEHREAADDSRTARTLARYGGEDRRWMAERRVGLCPRCSYQGEGLSYFSRGMHAAGLVGATALTIGAMGAGGIIYYLMRRDHRVCPRCGKGWGRYGEYSLAPVPGRPMDRPFAQLPSSRRESVRRVWSVALWVFAVMLMIGAIVSVELAPALVGAAAGAGGWMLHRAANQAREERRAALLAELQLSVLRLAGTCAGRLTVTEVAAELGWPLRRAERVLESMEDGLRVSSEVSDEGVIVYEFREVLHSPRRLAEGEAPESGAGEG